MPQDILAQEPVIPRLFDRLDQALAGERIFVPDVNEAFVASDGARPDDHALQHGMRITLDDAPVHKGAGVALIGVADDDRLNLARLGGVAAGLPLDAGRESAAAAASQPGALDLDDDLLRTHLGHRLHQGGVSVDGDVIVDPLGIDDAAVAEHHQFLLGEEGNVLQCRYVALFLLSRRRVHEVFNRPSLQQVLLDQEGGRLLIDAAIKDAVRLHDDDGTLSTESLATGSDHLDFAPQSLLFNFGFQGLGSSERFAGNTSGSGTNENM